jgi:hypothetical protein
MNYTYSFPFSWVLAFQVFILTVLSKVDEAAIIGYYVNNNTSISLLSTPSDFWRSTLTRKL